MPFTVALSQQNTAHVAVKTVSSALDILFKGELEYNTKNKGLK
ncbi:hypothetical protein T4B_9719 [Trichinella pseudospiralis]|uniref:Uncharacterized protein n=2 Tax=Trichinella pseudospiralis TaxID=6337 RepID=A0A0V1GCW0_TRIPS|nr:hypothetical protein T4D_1186 [Trichinella pseudospiralis]KRY95996.1 hypothetical protein T4C_13149 [Trichinella pseudospiralis]KRY96253.1 hypothetical protein T4B_9719 [Trichinella pseudospiralis]KRY99088.1 hypothetical protein T4C_11902 [Trichinella pseudospiralis]KRZ00507.1 hypothetical protein T4C_12172 [Trichinella pseudospiralis]